MAAGNSWTGARPPSRRRPSSPSEAWRKLNPESSDSPPCPSAGWPGEPWQRAPAVSEEDREGKLLSDVEEFGWHVVLIPEDDEGPAFAYNVGLFGTFEHPEIVVLGLDLGVMHRLII